MYENYYSKQRKKQARLALQPPTNMVSSCLKKLSGTFPVMGLEYQHDFGVAA